jgi:hypothetical protein
MSFDKIRVQKNIPTTRKMEKRIQWRAYWAKKLKREVKEGYISITFIRW